jgi:hypothetical protein
MHIHGTADSQISYENAGYTIGQYGTYSVGMELKLLLNSGEISMFVMLIQL